MSIDVRVSETNKKKIIFYGITFFILLTSSIIFLYWLLCGRFYETTDNAYVGGNKLVITSQIAGIATQIGVDDSFFVKEGHLLVTLDPTDRMIALQLEKEKLARICREVVSLFEQVKEKQADVAAKQARFDQSVLDWEHRETLLPYGAATLEDSQRAKAAQIESEALLNLAKAQLEAAVAQVQNTTPSTHPKVVEAIESFKNAYVQLQRCSIVAPASGIIAQRGVQVGKWVDPKDALMALIPLSQMWVDANFREVQMKKIGIGQTVELQSDYYGSAVKYTGKIVGIGAGTGSAFSLLPPQNATGNWVKIVQRVPVRIALDPKQLEKYPLRLGLSMKAKVDLRNQEGGRIPKLLPPEVLYETTVFENQERGAEELAQGILEQNIPPRYFQIAGA